MARPSRIENAVFLVGAERSGSTLLSHMLDHHPQIAWCRGVEFAVTMVQLRDGRDAGRSAVGMGWAGNMWMAIRRSMDAESLWDGLKPKLAKRQFHEVKYEALIDAPEATLREICDFIGVPYASERAAPMLQAHGYRLSGLPPVPVGWWYRQWLREQDRYRRVRCRVQRNGLMLVASDFLARHLHTDFWAHRVHLRLNAIEVKHLK